MKHNEDSPIRGEDIPLIKLKKVKCREIKPKAFTKLRTTIKKVGLIEPLLVSPCKDGCYNILSGELCFEAMLEMGYETAPCIVYDEMDIYTTDYHVNHLSPVEEARMMKKALGVVGEHELAEVFGLKKITFRLPETLANRLHPKIVKAYDEGTITRTSARELAEVKPVRQLEIFAMMENTKNFGTRFVKKQVLLTPPKQRQSTRKTSPWDENKDRKKSLGAKLTAKHAELDHGAKLFRDYAAALMQTIFHCRAIITNKAIEKYLKANMQPIYTEIKAIIESELIEKKAPK